MVNKVYAAISGVTEDLSKIGIEKSRTADAGRGGKYAFRGIDDVYNALAPLLPKHGLVVVPRVIERAVTERGTAAGGKTYNVVLTVEFDFVCVEDGSIHTARAVGEAQDTGDKASNKAMSAAYKYCFFQVFCIPTEGDNDSENTREAGLPEDLVTLWAAEVDEAPDAQTVQEVWKRVAKACRAAKDMAAYSGIKNLVTARAAALKEAA